MTTTTKTAALYLRVSTDKQTVENQRAEVEQLARARGFDVAVYEEVGSAVKARPVFQRLLADVRAGRVQAVACWSLDRLGRGFEAFDTYRELARLNVRVLSVKEPWTDVAGPAQELLAAVMSWVSGFERQRLVDRTKAGLVRARAQGKRLGRPAASPLKVAAAVARVQGGASIREAAKAAGVGYGTVRRAVAA
jgi:putative DNA-invertase from lambdoid prophage Rac